MLAITWAGLALIVPAFEKMFHETGVCLPEVTQALISLSHVAWWAGPLALGLTTVAYRRRRSPLVRHALVGATLLCFALCAVAIPVLFMPLCSLGQRL
jgi:type II secretory pathway component PulF